MKKKRWIADATKENKGAFRKQAEKRGLSTKAFARKVLSNPEQYDERTRKRANLAKTLMGMTGHK